MKLPSGACAGAVVSVLDEVACVSAAYFIIERPQMSKPPAMQVLNDTAFILRVWRSRRVIFTSHLYFTIIRRRRRECCRIIPEKLT